MPAVRLDEYARHDATALADLLRRKEVSTREVAGCAIEAAAALADPLNAVVETFSSRAELVGDELPAGPFGGVPTMLKDLFHGEAGTICENGSRLSAGWVVHSESGLTARIRRAGLCNLGRTTTSEFGVLGTTETIAAGPTCSPWSTSHMAGGSSGGSAAAVGAGIVPVASASDGGGSIRIPASCCGVVGLKPSRGRVSWGPQVGEALAGWAVHFVVSRTVRDTAALLDCLGGPEPGDPFVIPQPRRPFAEELGAAPVRLRVGFATQPWSGDEPDEEVSAATETTARLLESLGHDVAPGRPEFPWEPFLEAMTNVWAADLAHMIDGLLPLLERSAGPETLEAPTLAGLEYGRQVTARQLFDAADVVNRVARAMGRYFADYDVLLTPTLGRLPAELGRYDAREPTELRDVFASWSPWEAWLPACNATGLPAISLPLHMSESGLPIGMQLVAPFGGEGLLLRLAAQLEEAAPWSARVPPLHASSAGGAPAQVDGAV
jgi:amidase